jgi:hypothetical protein
MCATIAAVRARVLAASILLRVKLPGTYTGCRSK